MPLFSIVIPSLNRGPLLARCLESLSLQDFADFETIVVDAGSTDSTPQVLQQYAAQVTAIVEQGIGVSDGRNAGVKQASGRFIVFVDSDDLLIASALRVYATLLDGPQPPQLLLAAFCPFWEERELAALEPPSAPVVQQFASYLDAASAGHLSGTHRLVIDRAVYLAAGGLSSAMHVCEDQDFGLRINQIGPCTVVLAPATIAYRQHQTNISRNAAEFARGAQSLVRNERRGVYPGGAASRRTRRSVITRTTRSASVGCLDQRLYRQALDLYLSTLSWHLGLMRLKYIVGFPLRMLASASGASTPNPS